MGVRSLDELAVEPRGVIEAYLRRVESSLCAVDATLVADVLEELTADACAQLDADSSEADARALVERLGPPDSFGESLCEVLREEPSERPTPASGTLLGIPYDVRVPTAERVAARWWNTHDRRIFMPRVFGIGWDLNFGAIAVRLHLIEADAEDIPFESAPQSAFLGALLVPVGCCAALLGSYLALRDSLPPELPSHWSLTGEVDGWWPAASSFALLLALALAPTAWAVWSVATRRASLGRGAVIGLATMMASLSAGLWVLTLVSVGPERAAWWAPLAIIALSFGLALAVLVALARAGRAAEIERDLNGATGPRG